MSTTYQNTEATGEIGQLLAGLRWRIRAYVWVEGIVTVLLWLVATFWLGLLIDYSPVLVWASELPRAIRALGLCLIGGVGLYLLYQRIIRRAFVRLADRSMAVVLERRYQDFRDSLVTSVELSGRKDAHEGLTADMLDSTNAAALAHVSNVRLGDVFNLPPLYWKMAALALLIAPMGAFRAYTPDLFNVWVGRMYGLSDQPWPRNAEIAVVGIKLQREATETTQELPDTLVQFAEKKVKIARGSSVKLLVKADADAKTVPDYCTIHYRGDDGSRGSVNMQKIGRIGNKGYQEYSYDGKPLKGVLSDLRFDVVGFDHRVRNYQIEIVDSPAVVQTILGCTFPDYLVDEATTSWQPREIEYRSSGVKLPQGTEVVIKCNSNKKLKSAHVVRVETGEPIDVEMNEDNQFEFPVKMDEETVTVDIILHDQDDVIMDRPERLTLTSVKDAEPKVNIRMQGIGSAVTAEVIIPIAGQITDDYLVDRSWFEALRGDDQEEIVTFPLGKEGAAVASIDFRQLRSQEGRIRLKAGDKLNLTIKAADRYNLDGASANVGSSDKYQIDVVTPNELLATLERRELGIRRRFEQVIEEIAQMRDSFVRIRGDMSGEKSSGSDPGDAADPGDAKTTPEKARQMKMDLRLIHIQQGVMQSQKSAQEVLGVSAGFRDIREELVNNRVDTEDRKSRLKELIADPLQLVGETMFPELDRRLMVLEKNHLEAAGVAAADEAITQTNDILLELNKVLEEMINIASFNELIELVRTLIDDQESLLKKTEAKRKASFFDD